MNYGWWAVCSGSLVVVGAVTDVAVLNAGAAELPTARRADWAMLPGRPSGEPSFSRW